MGPVTIRLLPLPPIDLSDLSADLSDATVMMVDLLLLRGKYKSMRHCVNEVEI
jgi:hypothetical protein